uniref:Menorin-like domain-containing protein n=1 Tax=Anoplophora glabripennis TaxID=217634 RepID=V5I8P8_ANOGL
MYFRNCVYFLCGCVAFGAMASPDVTVFFPEINGNLSSITWAHAVNNQSYLNSTLNDNNIMMIEADIVLGTLTGTNNTNGTNATEIPVMGHPPSNTSDLSLENFLTTIDLFNTNATNTTTRKGVKLDFKSIEVFNASITLLRSYNQGRYPIWLNADILEGPINATTVPVNADQFLQGASEFNNTVLSIGWTTNFGANMTGNYTTAQISSMTTVIRQNNVTQNITFPVRAGLAAESLSVMSALITNVTGSTLTLWSSEGDNVNVTNLRNLIAQIGVGRVFIDIPDDLRNQLSLDNLPSTPVAPGGASSLMPKLVVSVLVALLAFICK